MKTAPYLQLDRIKHDLNVEKLLPPEVARQYHALPISYDGHRLTVAISSPDDPAASTMVSSSLGRPVCFVRADPSAIDHRLAEIWPEDGEPECKLLVWASRSSDGSPACQALNSYAENLARLLHAGLSRFEPPAQPKDVSKELHFTLAEFKPDLVIAGMPGGKMTRAGSKSMFSNRFLNRLPVSTLIVPAVRWPIGKILLALIDSSPNSDLAVDWAARLAQSSRTEVVILPVLPPVPPVYGFDLHYDIPSLLISYDPFGQTMRRIAERFSSSGIQAAFRLRQGDPADQLLTEIAASGPDLVVLAAEDPRPLHRAMAGSLIRYLGQAPNCPVLIARQSR